MNLANIPIIDKLGLHQCIEDMLRDEVINLALSMRKLEDKYNAVLENQQADFQPTIIELEGTLLTKPVSILLDPRASLSYVNPKIVEM